MRDISDIILFLKTTSLFNWKFDFEVLNYKLEFENQACFELGDV